MEVYIGKEFEVVESSKPNDNVTIAMQSGEERTEENGSPSSAPVNNGDNCGWFKLPVEIKSVVISYLDNKYDRIDFRSTCKSIRETVDCHKLELQSLLFIDFQENFFEHGIKTYHIRDEDATNFVRFMSFYYVLNLEVINTPTYLDAMVDAMKLNPSVSVKCITMQFGDVKLVEMFLQNNAKIEEFVFVGDAGEVDGPPEEWMKDVLRSTEINRIPRIGLVWFTNPTLIDIFLENWITNDAPFGNQVMVGISSFNDHGGTLDGVNPENLNIFSGESLADRRKGAFPRVMLRTNNPMKEILAYYYPTDSYYGGLFLRVVPAGSEDLYMEEIESMLSRICSQRDVGIYRYSRANSFEKAEQWRQYCDEYNIEEEAYEYSGDDDDDFDDYEGLYGGVRIPEMEEQQEDENQFSDFLKLFNEIDFE